MDFLQSRVTLTRGLCGNMHLNLGWKVRSHMCLTAQTKFFLKIKKREREFILSP